MKILEELSLNYLLWHCLATIAILKLIIELKRSGYLRLYTRSQLSFKAKKFLIKKIRNKTPLKSN